MDFTSQVYSTLEIQRKAESYFQHTKSTFRPTRNGQARSSFRQGGLKSVYIKTQKPVLCRQREFLFSLGLFSQEKGDSALIGHKSN